VLHKPLVSAVLVLCLGGCATHAVTSGRFVVRDTPSGGPSASVDLRFSDHDRRLLQDYYRGKGGGKHKKTPPGLAKRDQLPPGLARRDTLPPGLQGRNLPGDLESRLTPLPAPYVRVIVGGDIVLLHGRTRVVVDLLSGIVAN
jgi:hypothetical protein